MNVYTLIDCERLEEKSEAALRKNASDIETTLTQFIDNLSDDKPKHTLTIDCSSDFAEDWQLGLNLQVNNKNNLKAPIELLNKVAKDYKVDFVLGIDTDGEREDICYFGFEEGAGDRYAIAQYLDL